MPESTDAGGRKPRVTDADLLDVFRETADPVLSTAEVSDALPIKRRGTLNRLRALEAEDALDSKTVGGRNTVWWLAGTGASDDARRETAIDAARSDPGKGPVEDTDDIDGDTGGVSDTVLAGALGDISNDRRRAVEECVRYLRGAGSATKSDFIENVYETHPAGYESAGGWWNKIGKEYLQAVAKEATDLSPPVKEGSHTWRYTGAGS